MERYEMMRDCGRPLLGQIPRHWKILRMKNVFEVVSERNHPDAEVLSLYREYGVLPKSSRDDNYNVTSEDTASYKFVRVDDLVINKMKAWQGSLGISQYEGIVSPAYYVCRFINSSVSKRYYHYLLRSRTYAQEFERLSTGMRVGQWDLGIDDFLNVPALIPPLTEQEAIASYLDDRVSQIDLIIAEALASIEEYKEWKTSIIFEATTKGVHSDAKMKDTGIPWIGTVPSHWRVTKTLHCLAMAITDGPHTTPELFDSGIPFISAEAVSCGNGRIDFSHMRGYISQEFYEECCKKYIPQIDDVYMIKSGATTGRVAIVDTDKVFTIWSPLAVFRANRERILPMFLFYALQSDSYQKQVEWGWTYGTQQNIGMRTLEALKICLPPIDEQAEIVSYLEERCGTIDSLIKEKEAVISDLESFKRSLVYEIVTGKRKVV